MKAITAMDLPKPFRDRIVQTSIGEWINHPLYHSHFFPVEYEPDWFGKVLRMRQQEARDAYRAKDWDRWVFIHERPYRTQCLQRLFEAGVLVHCTEQAGKLTRDVWTDSENINQNLFFWYKIFTYMQTGDLWMEDEDKTTLDLLFKENKTITVYRGECDDGGWSWTLNKSVAKKFANRFGEGNAVLVAEIEREHVWCYTNARGEEEIIITETIESWEDDEE